LGVRAIALHLGLYERSNAAGGHRVVRQEGPPRPWLDGATNGGPGVAAEAPEDRRTNDAPRPGSHQPGLLPGLVRRYGKWAVFERDARTVLDLRAWDVATPLRAVSADAPDQGRRWP